MVTATYILFVLGCLGATDILLYHSVAHGLRKHPDSRLEVWVHSLRAPIYATLFVLVPNFALYGGFFWLLIGILVCDVSVSLVDFSIERKSREFFGGLPSGEYVLHILIAMLFGALVASVFFTAHQWAFLPSRLTYIPAAVPTALRIIMAIMSILVLGSGSLDATAAARLTKGSK